MVLQLPSSLSKSLSTPPGFLLPGPRHGLTPYTRALLALPLKQVPSLRAVGSLQPPLRELHPASSKQLPSSLHWAACQGRRGSKVEPVDFQCKQYNWVELYLHVILKHFILTSETWILSSLAN